MFGPSEYRRSGVQIGAECDGISAVVFHFFPVHSFLFCFVLLFAILLNIIMIIVDVDVFVWIVIFMAQLDGWTDRTS